MKPYKANIEEETVQNEKYRKVLYTAQKMQLVVMSLQPEEDIPVETHEDTDQFIRVESGVAMVRVDGKEFSVGADEVIIIPASSEHYVKNASDEVLKLYSVYAPPEHPDSAVHERQEDADEEE